MIDPCRFSEFGAAAVLTLLLVAPGTAGAVGKAAGEAPPTGERLLEESFELSGPARLRVEVSDVDVELAQNEGGLARVEVYVSGRDRERAREAFERLRFAVGEESGTVTVETRPEKHGVSLWNWSPNHVTVRALITIPRGSDMFVRTSDGDIRAEGLEGRLEARTSDGDIVLVSVEGPAALLRTSDGDIRVDRIAADQVEGKTSDGDVRIERVSGANVAFSTSDGDIAVDDVRGEQVDLKTSDGDIEVTARADALRAQSSDGDLRVTLTGSSGLEAITSDGNIAIRVPASLDADLDLKGDKIHLIGGVEIEGEVSPRRVRGSLGTGGPSIAARTTDGKITFSKY